MEKEYKQAKLKAAKTLGVRVLPSNLEVALELDNFAAETEGEARIQRLIKMREQALLIMNVLRLHCPMLLGSVWRGTIKRNSDIDIEAYSDKPKEIVACLEVKDLRF